VMSDCSPNGFTIRTRTTQSTPSCCVKHVCLFSHRKSGKDQIFLKFQLEIYTCTSGHKAAAGIGFRIITKRDTTKEETVRTPVPTKEEQNYLRVCHG
jgi:hypothetical protein